MALNTHPNNGGGNVVLTITCDALGALGFSVEISLSSESTPPDTISR